MIDTERMTELSVEFLDAAYLEIVERAKRLAEQYFEQAQQFLGEEGKTHVPILIGVQQISPNAWGFYWVRVHYVREDGKGNAVARKIPKGPRHKYPAGAFSFVKGTLLRLVRNYEARLAELRQLAAENRALRKTTLAWTGRYQKVQVMDDLIYNGVS
ncbi:conjugative transfer protein MobI(A/C) [Azotobacter chroococcum]|uniref:conjugative transfer protein MobI(A/C) n=1 Tax=Azotobacter chroococcum TaxID=353 RepID=UPI00201DF081|nr:conjugative transfer protein MobI(A/C) [Azotobacter chroococcum]